MGFRLKVIEFLVKHEEAGTKFLKDYGTCSKNKVIFFLYMIEIYLCILLMIMYRLIIILYMEKYINFYNLLNYLIKIILFLLFFIVFGVKVFYVGVIVSILLLSYYIVGGIYVLGLSKKNIYIYYLIKIEDKR